MIDVDTLPSPSTPCPSGSSLVPEVTPRHLFDVMPPPKNKAKKAAAASGGGGGGERDRIGALPDEVLHHILSFLQAQGSVRTCVLGRPWRHLWKSPTGLRLVAAGGHS